MPFTKKFLKKVNSLTKKSILVLEFILDDFTQIFIFFGRSLFSGSRCIIWLVVFKIEFVIPSGFKYRQNLLCVGLNRLVIKEFLKPRVCYQRARGD